MPDRAPLPKPCPNPAQAGGRNTRAQGYPPTGGTRRGTVARSAGSGATVPKKNDVHSDLRAAVREVTAAYNALPPSLQVHVGPANRDGLDAEVSAAGEDPPRALAAIRSWRRHWLATFEEAGR